VVMSSEFVHENYTCKLYISMDRFTVITFTYIYHISQKISFTFDTFLSGPLNQELVLQELANQSEACCDRNKVQNQNLFTDV
jgi:hypothetical protein